MSLSAATIAAQQALSDKYGIPTFGLKGEISTVPLSGKLSSLAATVGVGQYTAESGQSLKNTLQGLINTVKSTGGSIGNTIFQAPPETKPTSQVPPSGGAQPPNTNPSAGAEVPIVDQFTGAINGLKSAIGPTGLLVGLGLITLLIVTRNRGG